MTRPRRDAPTHSISPKLIDQFEKLLSTWPLLEKWGKVTIKESDIPQGLGWEVKLEDKLGDEYTEAGKTFKTYSLRRDDLFWRLSRLVEAEGKDPEAIFAILNEAKKQASEAAQSGLGTDWQRDTLMKYSRLKRKIERARGMAERIVRGREALFADPSEAADFTHRAQVLYDEFHIDLILPKLQKGPLRRPGGAGRPRQPWLAAARRKFADLGLSRENADALRMDVGLLPFSCHRFTSP